MHISTKHTHKEKKSPLWNHIDSGKKFGIARFVYANFHGWRSAYCYAMVLRRAVPLEMSMNRLGFFSLAHFTLVDEMTPLREFDLKTRKARNKNRKELLQRHFHVYPSTVSKFSRKLIKFKSVKNFPRSGRPRITPARQDRSLLKTYKNMRWKNSKDISTE